MGTHDVDIPLEPGETREPGGLRHAAVRNDALCVARPDDSLDLLDLWEALVAGEWVIAEVFERAGRRYLVLLRCLEVKPRRCDLSKRESQVAALAALGRPLKDIAYELRLSCSSVATYLRRSLAKLGLPDRLSLVQSFAAFAVDPCQRPRTVANSARLATPSLRKIVLS